MFLDAQNLFSDAQAVTITAVSTNVIDLSQDRNIGIGEPMAVLITIDVAADVANADETYQFDLQTDATDAFGSPTVIASQAFTTAQATTDLLVGARVVLPVRKDLSAEEVLRLNYTTTGTTPSVTVTAALLPQSFIQAEALYPTNIVVSV